LLTNTRRLEIEGQSFLHLGFDGLRKQRFAAGDQFVKIQ
jgi:hypothetical protein